MTPPATELILRDVRADGTALAALGRLGAATLSTDAVVHELYASSDEVRDAVVGRWGQEVLAADGTVDPAAGLRTVGTVGTVGSRGGGAGGGGIEARPVRLHLRHRDIQERARAPGRRA